MFFSRSLCVIFDDDDMMYAVRGHNVCMCACFDCTVDRPVITNANIEVALRLRSVLFSAADTFPSSLAALVCFVAVLLRDKI